MTLYRVRLQYAISIEAVSMGEAHKQACKQIADSPGLVIGEIVPATEPKRRSVVARLITGK